jgi:energy-coupling factor transporter ATP-binding protein EcfA2
MRDAGIRAGITVFPGVEVTTSTGSDGIHILLIGDLTRTARDIDILLAKTCGFDDQRNPSFNPATGTPAAAPRSITDILDDLPDGWLAIAPHALCDNGIASCETVKGSNRWRALHHDRLVALDVGGDNESTRSGGETKREGFNAEFRKRTLANFPCLDRIAFISTSDSYSLDTLGSRFTWIRMAEPSFEGLRQAFLDHEARIIRDSDPKRTSKSDPNEIDHSWIEAICVGGTIANSTAPLTLEFDPRLNVIIGGRGSGKSTVVAALRQVYGSVATLPESLRPEAEDFVQQVFGRAVVTSRHRLPISGEQQETRWTAADGSTTDRGGARTATSFPVRILAQKELYERARPDPGDPYLASRNLLLLIDEANEATGDGTQSSFEAERASAEYRCQAAVQARLQLESALSKRDELRARKAELRRQLEVLDDPDRKARREHNERLVRERADLEASAASLNSAIAKMREQAEALLPDTTELPVAAEHGSLEHHQQSLRRITGELRQQVQAALLEAEAKALQAREARLTGPWAEEAQRAVEDDMAYQAELVALGVDSEQYNALREDLSIVEATLADLERKGQDVVQARQTETSAWDELAAIYATRRRRRGHLGSVVAKRSGSLRFEIKSYADCVGWVSDARKLLNLRADGFIADVQALSQWLWYGGTAEELDSRLALWRDALINGNSDAYRRLTTEVTQVRRTWWDRLRSQDFAVRLRLATLLADDVITMRFLREGQDPDKSESWQEVTHGSPGQRSAAMLSFVLHHGIEPLVLDQPEDDLDTALISQLVVKELRKSRWRRQVIVVTHNANIPVLGDAERVIALENQAGCLRIKTTSGPHVGPLEIAEVRCEIQNVMEGGVPAFITREQRYDNELSTYRQALSLVSRKQ